MHKSAITKHSLLYEKFCVLNEINNLRIAGERIEPALKQQIQTDCGFEYPWYYLHF